MEGEEKKGAPDLLLIKKEGTISTYRNVLTNEIVKAVSDCFTGGDDSVKYYQVKIVKSKDMSLVKLLAILKRLHPSLGRGSNSNLLNEFKNTDEWVLGGLLAEETELLIKRAKENGIEIKLEK